jgi:hypothetical protein
MGMLHKSLGFIHIDRLKDIIMKKYIIHINLMDLPSLGFCNGKCQTYGIHILYWSEGIIIVNAMHLLKYFGNYPSFVFANMSIYYTLGHVDTSAPDKFPS